MASSATSEDGAQEVAAKAETTDAAYVQNLASTVHKLGGKIEAFNDDLANTNTKVDKVQSQVRDLQGEVKVMNAEFRTEVRDVLAAFREAEADRRTANAEMTGSIDKLSTNLVATESKMPTKETFRNYFITAVSIVVATLIAVFTVWATGFGSGAAIEDQVTENAVEQSRRDRDQDERLERVIDALEDMTNESKGSDQAEPPG